MVQNMYFFLYYYDHAMHYLALIVLYIKVCYTALYK